MARLKSVTGKKSAPAKKAKAKRYDSEESRRRLLEAAVDVFSAKGYDAATTRDIAGRAGLNISLIQHYFEGKSGLLISILEDFRKNFEGGSSYPTGETLEKEIENFFRMRIDMYMKAKKIIKILFLQVILDEKVRAKLIERHSIYVDPTLQLRLKENAAAGKIRKDVDLEKIAKVISAVSLSWIQVAVVVETVSLKETYSLSRESARMLATGISAN